MVNSLAQEVSSKRGGVGGGEGGAGEGNTIGGPQMEGLSFISRVSRVGS